MADLPDGQRALSVIVLWSKRSVMREKLPSRRPRLTVTFEHAGHTYHGGAGFYEDGRIGEVFLTAGKSGTHLQNSLHDASIAASIALQRGSTVRELLKACIKNEDGTPAGAMGQMFMMLVDMEDEDAKRT